MDGASSEPVRHRVDVDAYHRMAKAGIFREGERVELIDGDLIDMAPIGSGHAGTVSGLTEVFVVACAGRATVWTQNPIRLDRSSEPQPDVAVLRRRADFYTSQVPGPEDVLLIVEVADTSLRFDQEIKLPLYARAGIGETWIIDLKRCMVEVNRDPAGDAYRETTTHHAGDRIALALAPEIIVRLDLVFAGPGSDGRAAP